MHGNRTQIMGINYGILCSAADTCPPLQFESLIGELDALLPAHLSVHVSWEVANESSGIWGPGTKIQDVNGVPDS